MQASEELPGSDESPDESGARQAPPEEDSSQREERERKGGGAGGEGWALNLKWPLLGGAVAAVVAFVGAGAVGRISGVEARVVLESMLPTTRFLASGMMTASATILALMLTVLGLSSSTETTLRPLHYRRVKQIAFIDAIAFVCATVFLLLLSVPVGESEQVPAGWYSTIYYIVLVISALLGGLLITIVLALYDTIRDMIRVVGLETPEYLIRDES